MPLDYLTVDYLSRKDLARIFSKIRISTERSYNSTPCWEWTGRLDGNYARISYKGRMEFLHRLLYAWLICPILRGHGGQLKELDHLCRNTICSNPLHLEHVPHAENVYRGDALAAENKVKTHCKRKHPLDGANLYINAKGSRCCRECSRQRARNRYRRLYGKDMDYTNRQRTRTRERLRKKYHGDPEWTAKVNARNAKYSRERRKSCH